MKHLKVVGSAEAAAMAGMTTSAFKAYRSRGEAGIPKPDAVLACGPIWRMSTIEKWVAARA